MDLRRVRVLLVGTTLVASLLSVAPAPASAQRCALETVTLRSFKVEAKPRKKAYSVGDTIVFDVKVVRPDDSDPFGMGAPMPVDKTPAEEVNVGAGLIINDVFLSGFAITDAEGKAVIKIKIEKYARPGVADAAFYAWKTQAETPCLRVEENGFRAYPEIVTVKP